MKRRGFKTVDDYIQSQAEPARRMLRRVRAAIRKALPRAEETISYKIPAYRLNGRTVIYFAGWKEHFSLYPAGKRLIAEFQEELAPYEVKGSTIRFRLAERPAMKLIERIAKFRAREIDPAKRAHSR